MRYLIPRAIIEPLCIHIWHEGRVTFELHNSGLAYAIADNGASLAIYATKECEAPPLYITIDAEALNRALRAKSGRSVVIQRQDIGWLLNGVLMRLIDTPEHHRRWPWLMRGEKFFSAFDTRFLVQASSLFPKIFPKAKKEATVYWVKNHHGLKDTQVFESTEQPFYFIK
jgi:hypothetical protein